MRSGLVYLAAGIVIGAVLMMVLGAAGHGEYQVEANDTQVVMFETTTGQAWVLGGVSPRMRWAEIER